MIQCTLEIGESIEYSLFLCAGLILKNSIDVANYAVL